MKINRHYTILILLLMLSTLGINISHLSDGIVVKYYGNLAPLLASGLLLGVAIWSIKHFGIDGVHGIGWISFVIFAIFLNLGQMMWILFELVLSISPYPSVADLFYVLGYPFLFIFLISYLLPFRDKISRKLVMTAIIICVISIMLLLPSQLFLMDVLEFNVETLVSLSYAFSIAYVAYDSILLFPIILGLGLFLQDNNRIKFTWVLIYLGVLFSLAGDSYFIILEAQDGYYTGHPVELSYIFSHLLIAFGVYGYGTNKNFKKIL